MANYRGMKIERGQIGWSVKERDGTEVRSSLPGFAEARAVIDELLDGSKDPAPAIDQEAGERMAEAAASRDRFDRTDGFDDADNDQG